MPSIIFINVKSNYFKEHAAVSSPKSHEIGQRETTIYIFLWRWRINLVEKVWLSCSPSLWVWTFHTPSVHIIPLWTSVNSRVTNISDRRVAKTRNLSNQERQRYRIIVWWEVNEEVENSGWWDLFWVRRVLIRHISDILLKVSFCDGMTWDVTSSYSSLRTAVL